MQTETSSLFDRLGLGEKLKPVPTKQHITDVRVSVRIRRFSHVQVQSEKCIGEQVNI